MRRSDAVMRVGSSKRRQWEFGQATWRRPGSPLSRDDTMYWWNAAATLHVADRLKDGVNLAMT
jgi:hypothetical protein